jgi:hypothetical protein
MERRAIRIREVVSIKNYDDYSIVRYRFKTVYPLDVKNELPPI